jgi:peptide/nickel transport system ATP-binding protein
MIAMAVANSPSLLIADEPTTALDVTVQAEVLRTLKEGQRRANAALILISHNIAVISDMTDEMLVMYAGRVVECGPTDELLAAPQHPYTQGLVRAIPTRHTVRGSLRAIPGQAPMPPRVPTGCSFHPRCILSQDRALCREAAPDLLSTSAALEHKVACHFSSEGDLWDQIEKPVESNVTPESQLVPARAAVLRCEMVTKDFAIRSGLALRTVGRVRAVDQVDLELFPAETLALVGESGSGKSTLARVAMGLISATSGTVQVWSGPSRIDIGNRQEFTRHVQIVLQDPYASLNPRMRVRDLLAEPLRLHRVGKRPDRDSRVSELLEMVGLSTSQASRHPGELSGGQRQRVAIARALALEPRVLILDEPTSALDVSIQAQILNLLLDLRLRLKLSILFVSHDISVVRYMADRVAVMYQGRIVEVGDVSQVCDAPTHEYTQRLLASVPEIKNFVSASAGPTSGATARR